MDKIVREWVKKAEQDFGIAHYLLKKRTAPAYDGICFHCQQCVEKYLKAFLTSQKIPFPKIHGLERLVVLATKKDGTFTMLQDIAKTLNPYAVDFRYPGEEADRKEAKLCIKKMDEARSFIHQKL